MEISTRYNRSSQTQTPSPLKQRRSGYEPSDTETDWQETPSNGPTKLNVDQNRKASPLKLNRGHSAKFDHEQLSPAKISTASPIRRRHNRSPYKPQRENTINRLPTPPGYEFRKNVSNPLSLARPNPDIRKNISPFSESNRRRYVSPFKPNTENLDLGNNGHRSMSAPRSKPKNNNHQLNSTSVTEINELVANAKISRGHVTNSTFLENSDSISQGDIFFSRNYTVSTMKKNPLAEPNSKIVANGNFKHDRNFSNSLSRRSSNWSDFSEKTTDSTKKFTENRAKSQKEAWFSCIKKGSCRSSRSSPGKNRAFDEASFIERAFVVESLRQFWADKYQPGSLNGFTCHKQEAQLLKQLVNNEICPHILLKGPSGSGKKALAMAFLREIYGDSALNISHEQKYIQITETNLMEVIVPVTKSPHHVELNLFLDPNSKYALMALVKQISSDRADSLEISTINLKADYTVMVLHDVDKADDDIQRMIKWIMDCYTDVCKLVLLCEDDTDVIESVKTRCKVLKIDAPITHEIMEVLVQIARKENFELSMNFAAKIATKSKQNLRKAIMALEACKAHNYPFTEDQPIMMGWEDVVIELAAEVLADPSPKKLFFVRGKFQILLAEFVHPKLILQKLVEQFLKGVEAGLKRELYYWNSYYEKRLPSATSALLKLEEFVAKFMSIYRKSSSNRQYSSYTRG